MIIYSLVARGSLVLAEYTNHDGDFPTFSRKLIAKSQKTATKKTLLKENFAFTYFNQEDFTFLCMTDTSFSREVTYKFLDDLSNNFYIKYNDTSDNDGKSSWATTFTVTIKKLIVKRSGRLPF